MKSRDVVGKKIVRVEQGMVSPGPSFPRCNALVCLWLEDGTRLFPVVREGDTGYFVELVVNTKAKAAERRLKWKTK